MARLLSEVDLGVIEIANINVALSMLSAPELIAGHRAHPRVGAAKGASSSHSGVSLQGALEPMAQQVERIKVSYTR